jgi:hypothetical protein
VDRAIVVALFMRASADVLCDTSMAALHPLALNEQRNQAQ